MFRSQHLLSINLKQSNRDKIGHDVWVESIEKFTSKLIS